MPESSGRDGMWKEQKGSVPMTLSSKVCGVRLPYSCKLAKNVACCLLISLFVLFAFVQPTIGMECAWVKVDVDGPPARHSPGMAYDSRRKVVVLFGGITGRTRSAVLYGDTWEWDGEEWRLVATTGPTPRLGHAMVYDEARGVVVLFGGNDGTFKNDTWEWDGQEWRQVASTGPSPRSRYGMAYDKKSGTILLFGGIPRDRNDTWIWDGKEWHQVQTPDAPAGRSRLQLAYDESRERIVLFGGRLPNGLPTGDTWEWTGETWVRLCDTGPHERARHGMVYDPRFGTLISAGVAFAGRSNTLIWNGDQWVESPVSGLTPRIYYGMVYDAARQETIIFGGWDGDAPLGDMWRLTCSN